MAEVNLSYSLRCMISKPFALVSLIFASMMVCSCQSARVQSRNLLAVKRCPSAQLSDVECDLLVDAKPTNYGTEPLGESELDRFFDHNQPEKELRQIPEWLRYSAGTVRFLSNIEAAGIHTINRTDDVRIVVESNLTLNRILFASYDGGIELYQILTGNYWRSPEQFKVLVSEWVAKYIPGFSLSFELDGAKYLAGFMESEKFFRLIDQGLVPIGNHHDLMSHLLLFTDPRIRELTKRLSRLIVRANEELLPNTDPDDQTGLVKNLDAIWVSLQELTPVIFRDSNGDAYFDVIGGYSSIEDRAGIYAKKARSYNLNYILGAYQPFISEAQMGSYFNQLLGHSPDETKALIQNLRDFFAPYRGPGFEPSFTFNSSVGAVDSYAMLAGSDWAKPLRSHPFLGSLVEEAILLAQRRSKPSGLTDDQWTDIQLKKVFAREILSDDPPWKPIQLFHPDNHLRFIEIWIDFYENYFG